ncbi:MAG: decarboxylating 6-phosphogluconate dehydrogenase [Magnetococcales bacterium]|nr:decarboxylating 6-phosphogluconate dehydrogenase [Magnetococcales bacterium]
MTGRIGMVGLGRMGRGLSRRLVRQGWGVMGFDRSREAEALSAKEGVTTVVNLDELIALPRPRIVWLMIPAGAGVDEVVGKLSQWLEPGDGVVDGGNSFWRDSQRRADLLAEKGVLFSDCGVSNGLQGVEEGFGLMAGGTAGSRALISDLLNALAPPGGVVFCGPPGAGHFVKMVHNGVEYGMMQALVEGFAMMEKAPFSLDPMAVGQAWQQGGLVRSRFLELVLRAMAEDPGLNRFAPNVGDNGTGRWALQTAVELGVPTPVLSAALFTRFQSRGWGTHGLKLLAALRRQFGGHPSPGSGGV